MKWNELQIQKFARTVLLLLIIVGAVALISTMATNNPISNAEIRVFATSFLLLTLAVCVILFMVRNAVVRNTGFLIKLRESMNATDSSLKDLTRETQMSTKATGSLSKQTGKLAEELKYIRDGNNNTTANNG